MESYVTALGHDWSEVEYNWEKVDGVWKCTAARTCGNDHAHDQSETVTASGSITTPATCTEMGKTTYTATFTNTAFATQTKVETDVAATGHAWGTPTYVWGADNGSCKATRICTNDPDHVETETANASPSVTTPATCEGEGEATYTATFTNTAFATQTHTAVIPALGHDWGAWQENPDGNNHIRTCSRCGATETAAGSLSASCFSFSSAATGITAGISTSVTFTTTAETAS